MFNNIFGGKKKPTAPSTVSATSVARPEDPQNTIVKLREAIANQEKRYVLTFVIDKQIKLNIRESTIRNSKKKRKTNAVKEG